MSDRDASTSDAAFREALREYHSAAVEMATQLISADRWRDAESRVLALYAEAQQQGERDQLALAEQVAEATARMEQGRAERQGEGVSDAMVRRFLAWPLPASVCADPCASMPNYPHRSGTNLLTYTEAKEMLEYVVAGEQKGQTYTVEEHRGEPRVTLDGTYLKGDRVRVVKEGT